MNVTKIILTSCIDFSFKMHQIQFWLGLRPRPRLGSLQRSHRPLAGFEEEGRKRDGRGRKEETREREGKGEEREGDQ